MTYRSLRHAVAFALVASVVMGPGVAQGGADNPTAWEQWLIYDINRARWDPFGFATEHNLNPSGWQMGPLPPLAYNTQLEGATGDKAFNLAGGATMDSEHCTFYFNGQKECPNRLADRFDYPLPGWWSLDQNSIEVYWSGSGPGTPLGAELFMSSPGHRPILFDWGDREDIGAGWSDRCPRSGLACNFLFVHIGSREPFATFITGFVYSDSNSNGKMEFGEGLSGVTVSAGTGFSATTGAGGAYRIQVPNDRGYTVTASGTAFSGISGRGCVTGNNLGVDFRDLPGTAASRAVVHGYPGRIEGANRYETAASVARCSHPNPFPNGQGVVYIAVGTNYPDALAAAPAAAAQNAPILLTAQNTLPPSTQTELDRLHPETIVILGGSAAISDGVVNYLKNRYPGSSVVRRFGANRYATSAAVVQAAFPSSVTSVYITTGENYPDALMAGPPAAAEGGALLLTPPGGLTTEVIAQVDRLNPARIIVIGTTSAVSSTVFSQLQAYAPQVLRISNSDKFTQSALVSSTLLPNADYAYIATGNNFPDALAAGPLADIMKGSILLVGSTLPSAVNTELNRLQATSITVFGGPAAVTNAVVVAVRNHLGWS